MNLKYGFYKKRHFLHLYIDRPERKLKLERVIRGLNPHQSQTTGCLAARPSEHIRNEDFSFYLFFFRSENSFSFTSLQHFLFE